MHAFYFLNLTWTFCCIYFFSFRWRQFRGLAWFHQTGWVVLRLGAGEEQKKQEAPSPVLKGPDPGVGETLPPAALSLRPWEGATGASPQPHSYPGEDLVPEPPLQDEERPNWRSAAGCGNTATAGSAQSRCSNPGPGRETFSHLPNWHGEGRMLTSSFSGGPLPFRIPISSASLPGRSASKVPPAHSTSRDGL